MTTYITASYPYEEVQRLVEFGTTGMDTDNLEMLFVKNTKRRPFLLGRVQSWARDEGCGRYEAAQSYAVSIYIGPQSAFPEGHLRDWREALVYLSAAAARATHLHGYRLNEEALVVPVAARRLAEYRAGREPGTVADITVDEILMRHRRRPQLLAALVDSECCDWIRCAMDVEAMDMLIRLPGVETKEYYNPYTGRVSALPVGKGTEAVCQAYAQRRIAGDDPITALASATGRSSSLIRRAVIREDLQTAATACEQDDLVGAASHLADAMKALSRANRVELGAGCSSPDVVSDLLDDVTETMRTVARQMRAAASDIRYRPRTSDMRMRDLIRSMRQTSVTTVGSGVC